MFNKSKAVQRWMNHNFEKMGSRVCLYSYIYKFSLLFLPILRRWTFLVLEFRHMSGFIISLHVGQCRSIVSHGIFVLLELWSQVETNRVEHRTHHAICHDLMVVRFKKGKQDTADQYDVPILSNENWISYHILQVNESVSTMQNGYLTFLAHWSR